ncbi:MAG: acetate/propionate family kinase [Parahaliea sp.]
MKHVLVINSGSSSLKYQLVEADSGTALATGLVERIGRSGSSISHKTSGQTHDANISAADHSQAMAAMMAAFNNHGPDLKQIQLLAIGHRVVQGGARYCQATLIDDDVEQTVEALSDLAPLHNPPNLQGIQVAQCQFPDLPHIAVFDTAFHTSMPPKAYTYALSPELAEQYQIRRYGFHGTSHQYVSRAAAEFLGLPVSEANIIVLHLGNGASASAVAGGYSVDTSMGLTPLEGLVMGSRCGDIDPAIIFHMARSAGMSIDEIDTLLNRQSGMLGLSGMQDMRDIQAAIEMGNKQARLAMDIYCYRLRKYIGAYTAVLGRVDALVFTAGVGENSAPVRSTTLSGLAGLGYILDEVTNKQRQAGIRDISGNNSNTRILVIPTNEEWEIARQAAEVATTLAH